MSCFNITFHYDTEYEFDEAIKLAINTTGSDLNPGTITEADVVIIDDNSKINAYMYIIISESTVVLSMLGWHGKKMAVHTLQLQVMS